eukprot:CAMPEP_0115300614 /NCGR_PEP_ID=MMETSP0270-20121206/69426_1 /TAXON_ID=71861 /ORGANISM="Scrippsiella trochoidea, Strain CCMP3099" /LENGTH=178 /DNA_ID=CAMNT_0002718451 /DNA_START=121 /DNA_END=654 /DNA_ORIENTATION=+
MGMSAARTFVAPATRGTAAPVVGQQHLEVAGSETATPMSCTSAGVAVGAACFAAAAATASMQQGARRRASKVTGHATAVAVDVDTDCINAIRFLAVDAVKANGVDAIRVHIDGHCRGMALFAEEMKLNPADPQWVDRDRFVLSSGHGCMLQYSLLHLAGYSSVSLDDIKQFRQWGSKT